MDLPLRTNVADRKGLNLNRTNNTSSYFLKSGTCLFLTFFVLILSLKAQSIAPATINVAGQSASFGNYQFEWSVGESTSIITTTNSNLVITSGVLQGNAAVQSLPNTASVFLPGEIKIYPNPTRNIIEINILHRIAGKNKLELFDNQGRKVMEKQFEYHGTGMIEKWDLSRLVAGQYFLSIHLIDNTNSGKDKKGAFKIIKIQ